MSDAVANHLIDGAFVFLSSTLVWWGLRHQIKSVHTDINGRMGELIKAEKGISHQEGMDDQKEVAKEQGSGQSGA